MRRWWVPCVALVVGLCLGLCLGLVVERYAASKRTSEHTAELTNADRSGDYEVFYPRPFASPPNLEVIDPLPRDTFGRWLFKITEQRADGFKIQVLYSPSKSPPLRYSAQGRPGD
jgi:hypothetical protein